MTFAKGYNFTKVKTSHGPDMYVSRYGKLVRVVPWVHMWSYPKDTPLT